MTPQDIRAGYTPSKIDESRRQEGKEGPGNPTKSIVHQHVLNTYRSRVFENQDPRLEGPIANPESNKTVPGIFPLITRLLSKFPCFRRHVSILPCSCPQVCPL